MQVECRAEALPVPQLRVLGPVALLSAPGTDVLAT